VYKEKYKQQLAFESIKGHRFSVAPNVQWARAMIRGICAARSGRFTPPSDVSRMVIVRLGAIAVDRQLSAKPEVQSDKFMAAKRTLD
jgi:hypothetical protein